MFKVSGSKVEGIIIKKSLHFANA